MILLGIGLLFAGAIALHEVGHLLAARVAGLTPEAVYIGPWHWPGGICEWTSPTPLVALRFPAQDWERISPRQRAWIHLAGPALPLISAMGIHGMAREVLLVSGIVGFLPLPGADGLRALALLREKGGRPGC